MEQDEMKTKKGRKGITLVSPSFNVPLCPVSFSILPLKIPLFLFSYSPSEFSWHISLVVGGTERWSRHRINSTEE